MSSGRVDLELVTNPIQAKKLIAKPTTQHGDIITDNLVAIKKQKPKFLFDRPIYLGFCILNLSKIVMYQFHYETILPKYSFIAKLAYTDTDSFIYHIQTLDLYKDMAKNVDTYDTSDYPTDHPLYSKKNSKLLGKMKDECAGQAPHEFVGLRSKIYSIRLPNNKAKFAAKGISRKYI